MDPPFKKVLRAAMQDLAEILQPGWYIDCLFSFGFISEEELENLDAIQARRERTRALVLLLMRKPAECFCKFLSKLEERDLHIYKPLLALYRKTNCSEMPQYETKVSM